MSALPNILPNGKLLSKRAIIYSRVSTDEQAATGTGLDGQEAESLAYAESIGVRVVATFREDFTGTNLDRPNLNEARGMLRAGQAEVLIAHRPDRLDRSEWGINLMLLLQELKSLNVELHYSQQRRHIDLYNPAEALMQSIFGWQAGEDRNGIVKRLNDGRHNRVRAGYVVPCGIILYGYEKIFDKQIGKWSLTIVESEAAVIRLVYNLYLNGNGTGEAMSTYAVNARLNELGIPPISKRKKRRVAVITKSGKWNDSQVHRILTNEAYAGTWHYGKSSGKTTPVTIPAIVDRETWEEVQKRLKSRRYLAAGCKPKYEYLMARRIRCSCGYKADSKTNTAKRSYYVCPGQNYRSNSVKPCDMPSFRADQVDPVIWHWIQKIFEDETVLQDAIERYKAKQTENLKPLQAELQLIDQTLVEVEQEQEEYLRTLGRLPDSMTKAISNTQTAIKRCEQQLNELTAKRKTATQTLENAKQGERYIKSAVDFVIGIKADLGYLDWDAVRFETQRFLVDRLNIEAVLMIEDGQKYLDAKCYLGEEKLPLITNDKFLGHRN